MDDASSQSPAAGDVDLACPECGYNLTGVTGDRCPWCGWEIVVDLLVQSVSAQRVVQRVAAALTGVVVAGGSLVAVAYLLSGSRGLSLYDAVTVAAVLIASAGHLTLAFLAITAGRRWPLPHREVGVILRTLGWLSLAGAVVGASQALHLGGTRGVEGVVVSGVMQFVLLALLFAIPAWSLLVLRFVSFRGPHDSIRTAETKKASDVDGLPGQAPFAVEIFGPFAERQVRPRWTDATRPTTPEIESAIARAWESKTALADDRPQEFDNTALARLVGAAIVRLPARSDAEVFDLELGPSTFREFLGTNLSNAAAVFSTNQACFADPLGFCAVVTTSDGHLALGRRGDNARLFAGCLHGFGGLLELSECPARWIAGTGPTTPPAPPAAEAQPGASDPPPDAPVARVIDRIRRELGDVPGLHDAQPAGGLITGLVRDRATHQPQLILEVHMTLTRTALLDRFRHAVRSGGHTSMEFVYDDPESVLRFLLNVSRITAAAQAALLLHGRHTWGTTWYEQSCFILYGQLPPYIGATPLAVGQAAARRAHECDP